MDFGLHHLPENVVTFDAYADADWAETLIHVD